MLGGFFLGTLEVFLQALLPGSLLAVRAGGRAALIVVAILYVRPQGLFGQRAEVV